MGYAQFVGRVGALAVAMGVGVAVPAVAAAEPSDSNADADGNAGTSEVEAPEADAPDATPTDDVAAVDAGDVGLVQSGDSVSTVTQVSAGDAPSVTVRSSGGAHSGIEADVTDAGAEVDAELSDSGAQAKRDVESPTVGRRGSKDIDTAVPAVSGARHAADVAVAVDQTADSLKSLTKTVSSLAVTSVTDRAAGSVPALDALESALPAALSAPAALAAQASQRAPSVEETPVFMSLLRAFGVLPLGPVAPIGSPVLEAMWGLFRRPKSDGADSKTPTVTAPTVVTPTALAAPVEVTPTAPAATAAPSQLSDARLAAAAPMALASVADPGDAKWGEAYFAPYVDMGLYPPPDLLSLYQQRGTSLVTLGFIQADPNGNPAWAGLTALAPNSSHEQAQAINKSIADFQAAGGDVMVSLGGAAGTSMAEAYSARGLSADQLAAAYAGIVDTYDLNRMDFDIEGAVQGNTAVIALHSAALAKLQQEKPDLEVWYTLPVLPTGLTHDGLNVVQSALNAGVKLDGVNVMAMDYGESAAPTSGPNAQTMGAYAISAAQSTHDQLAPMFAAKGQDFGWNKIGVTPMIGVNDVTSEVFTPTDAQALEDFARAKGIGMLSFWSLTRDNPGAQGNYSSGTSAPAGSFSTILNDYGTVNVLNGTTPPPPTAPTLSIANVTVTEGNTGTSNAAFTVSLSKAATSEVTVGYATVDGTATAGSDYTASQGTVRFAPGVTSQTVNVSVAGDTAVEPTETFTVRLSNPTGATIATSTATGTITNDDGSAPPPPPPPSGTASASYRTTQDWGSGFLGSVDVKAGQSALNGWTVEFDSPANITNIWNADIAGKTGNHYVIKNASWNGQVAANGTTSFGFQADPGGASATVSNLKINGVAVGNPTPSVSIADVTVAEGNSGSRNAAFTVSLSQAPTSPVTVNYATANGTALAGSDYTATSGTLTFTPGGVTSQVINVPVAGDTAAESDETFTVGLSNASNATISRATATGTITNDDVALPSVTIADVTVAEGNSGSTNARFTVSLSQASASPVTVNYATANGTAAAGSDYTAKSGTLTFSPGTTTQTVDVPITGDTATELDETFTVGLSNASNATISRATATGTITNDDASTPQPGTASATYRTTDDWGTGFVGNVDVKAGQSSLNGWTVEFDTPAQIVNIWNAKIVSRQNNHYVVQNESWNPQVGAGQTTSFGFEATPGGVAATPKNFVVNGQPSNPTPQLPTVSIADVTVAEGNTGTRNAAFTVSLSQASTSAVTVGYATADGTAKAGSDYTAGQGMVTFAPGVISQVVNVSVAGDTAAEPNETFTVGLSNPVNATISRASATGTITNDDTAGTTPTLSISDASATEGTAGAAGPLHTSGNQILDSNGNPVQFAGVNWFGMEGTNGSPDGLWTRNYQDMIDQMKAEGFNAIRLPYSSENLHSTAPPSGIDYAKNPELVGMSRQQVMDEVVRYAGEQGMYIILDHHRSNSGAGASENGLWYNSQYTDAAWVSDWATLADRYKNSPNVVGFDLHNEPHNGTWGGGGATDWAAAAERAGNAILAKNPNALIIVEGVETYQGQNYWWGGNLMGVKDRPIVLNLPGHVVYSPHDYPNSIYPQPWFGGNNFAAGLPSKFDQMWGYIYKQDIAPVMVGEFGTKLVDPKDAPWFEAITSYMSGDFDNNGTIDIPATEEDISWTYWSWNPNSGDTGGILADDWQTVNRNKMVYLEPIQSDDVAGGGDGTTYATFAVTLASPSTQAVSVRYATASGTASENSDFTASSGTITFAPGETSKVISIPVKSDTLTEGSEDFTVLLSNPTGATIVDGSGLGTIHDQGHTTVGGGAVSGDGGTHDHGGVPTDSGGDTGSASQYIDLATFGSFHGSDHTGANALEGGRTAITTEALVAYNDMRHYAGLPPATLEEIGTWAFANGLTNNATPSGNDLQGVGLYYAMQGAKVGWIADDKYDPQIVADIERTARLGSTAAVMAMVEQYGHEGYAEYLTEFGKEEAFIDTLKMEPHYAGWMHDRAHGGLSIEGVATAHDVNHLTVLSHDQMQPFMNDTWDWPQWPALDVSDSGVIEYFQSMVVLGNPRGLNMENLPTSHVHAAM